MRRLAIVLAVLLVVAVAADVGVRMWTEAALARRIRDELALSEPPDLDLGGFPFLLQLARRRFPIATIDAEGVVAEGVRFRSVRLELRDVTFALDRNEVRARSGSGTVVLGEETATDALRAEGLEAVVRFRADGTVRLESAAFGSVTGRLRVQDGRLTLHADGAGAVPFAVRLPQLGEGVMYPRVAVRAGHATVAVRLEDATIRL